ncbi:MAG TPA: glycosyltransferase family 2 protein [Methylomirabilota bacterium]|jgi:glycosyltransferase involved in cell wall biosynthesis|nr:glycosyltransferase family 2 protein [Methylomirabilota bacterium]
MRVFLTGASSLPGSRTEDRLLIEIHGRLPDRTVVEVSQGESDPAARTTLAPGSRELHAAGPGTSGPRALGTLVHDGQLPPEVGVLLIRPAVDPLGVVRGLDPLRPLVVAMPWAHDAPELGARPEALADVAAFLGPRGFSQVALVRHGDEFPVLQLGGLAARPGDRGQALFVHERVLADLLPFLHDAAGELQSAVVDRALELREQAELRLDHIAELTRRHDRRLVVRLRRRWLGPRIGTLRQHAPRPLAIPARYRRLTEIRNPPRIALVTPTLNAARFVERTVQSVLAQKYPALEYVIQDGVSRDGTLAILDPYRHAIASVVSEPDRGQADAITRGFARTTGEILAWLGADDLLLPGSLHYVADFFTRHPDVDVVYGHRVLIDADDREIGRWVLPPHDSAILSWGDFVPQETLFWRRRLWERVGATLDRTFQFAMDWELLLRFRAAGARFARLPRFLGAFRVHDAQKTTAQMTGRGHLEMARLREREHGRRVPIGEVSRRLRPYYLRHIAYQGLYRVGLLRY